MFAPTTFGKYYLFEKLATGGMAEIYKGKLLGPGGFEKVLVIKQVLPALARRREFIELFVQEAKTTVSLSHGNIVPIYELGVIDGTYYTAMEYIDGPTLYELASAVRRAGKVLPVDLAVALVVEVLHGLDYAHRKGNGSGGVGVVHRDLSPRNVMISREGEVKILDFGIALAGEGGVGELAGSYAYMSPEQASRQKVDPRSDLFACGTLLWELLAGKLLFARDKPEETLNAVRAAVVAPPSSVRPEVPAELDAVVLRALAAQPGARAQSAQELLTPLMRWLYARPEPPGAHVLASWVEDSCPRGVTEASAPATQVGSARAGAGVSQTPPMAPESAGPPRTPGGGTGEVRTFATHVQLVELLSRAPDATDAGVAGGAGGAGDAQAPKTKTMTGRVPALREAAGAGPTTKAMTGRTPALRDVPVLEDGVPVAMGMGAGADTAKAKKPSTPTPIGTAAGAGAPDDAAPSTSPSTSPGASASASASPSPSARTSPSPSPSTSSPTSAFTGGAAPTPDVTAPIPRVEPRRLAPLLIVGAIAAAALGAVGVMLLRPARSSGRTPGAPVDAAPLVDTPAIDAAVAGLAVSPDAAPSALPAPAPDAATPGARSDAGPPPRRRDAGTSAPRPDAETPSPSGSATLTVGANPYGAVTVDGTRRGETPARNLPLSAGTHRVKVVCPADACPPAGRDFSFSVTLSAGEVATRAVDFTGPEPVLIQ
ncbi:MAG: protein kinase [Deltaproteobacteria bacterium]|nr:protein kinase [Deltaproteobacteria bacterium]